MFTLINGISGKFQFNFQQKGGFFNPPFILLIYIQMIRVANISDFDIADSIDGICISLWTAGCPHKCPGCHNSELWNGNDFPEMSKEEIFERLKKAMLKSDIKKNLSILGGEPLIPENIEDLNWVISQFHLQFPNSTIYLWSGYTLKELKKRKDKNLKNIFKNINYLIDGRFDINKKKNLKLRGSSNQNIYKKTIFGLRKINPSLKKTSEAI